MGASVQEAEQASRAVRRAPGPGGSIGPLGVVGLGLRARVAARSARLRDTGLWRDQSARLQAEQLRSLLTRAASTEFGRGHDFSRLASIADPSELIAAYRAAVAIRDWYGFSDTIARMREGAEPDVLWPGLVRDFAQTSGTTAGDKFIPVSAEMMRSNYRASLDIFGYLVARGMSLSRLTSGKCLFLGGCSDVRANEHGIRTGDLSGLVTRLIRWPLSAVYAPGSEVALIPDWPTKIERMAEAVIDQDVRFISGMPSWAGVLMERLIEMSRQRGRPIGGVGELWPNLEVFVHGGVRYGPFRPRVSELIYGDRSIDLPHRHELYPASEGFVAMQDAPTLDAAAQAPLRLNTDIGLFFEFVPLESIEDADPPAFTCDAVEPGVRYVVVLTTCAGLWRYVLGDVVEFESVPRGLGGGAGWSKLAGEAEGGPARLRIVGRHRHFMNAFGENIVVEHIENAVAEAAAAEGLSIGEFTAAPVYPDGQRRSGIELVIELEGADGPAIARFGGLFDQGIKRQNVDYTTKRGEDLGMAPPIVTPVPLGSFHRWMDSRGRLGGQNKCPRCANHRDYVDGVRAIAGVGGN